ncbi:hypothetical protein FEC77_00265 [Rickettsia parkeri]|nr:hypothetical protein FEC77_00265 [Rickettsia parkeri]
MLTEPISFSKLLMLLFIVIPNILLKFLKLFVKNNLILSKFSTSVLELLICCKKFLYILLIAFKSKTSLFLISS